MADQPWVMNPDGTIQTQPVIGWTIAVFPMNVMVRLDAYREEGPPVPLQFHLSGAQARELGEALLKRAAAVEAQSAALPEQ